MEVIARIMFVPSHFSITSASLIYIYQLESKDVCDYSTNEVVKLGTRKVWWYVILYEGRKVILD